MQRLSPFCLLAWNCAATQVTRHRLACMSKVLNGGCHVFKRRREGVEGREIALVVAVRRATDGSGWLALTPPHRETFKWQSACRAMVPCHNYRPKARERELSNAASMLNLGNTNKWRKACRRRNQNGSTRQTRKQPKYHWSPISLPQRPCKWLSIPLNLKYKIPDDGTNLELKRMKSNM